MENFNPVTTDPIVRDSEYPASMQTIIFESGGEKLIGTVFIPQGIGPHPVLLMLHGFPGNEVNFDLAHAARRDGWVVVVFHYRGGWGSGGSYSFANCVEDTNAAIEYIQTDDFANSYRADFTKLVVAGHSLGGFVSLKTVFESDELHNAAFFAGFNFGHFANLLQSIPWAKDVTLQKLNAGIELLTNASGEKLLAEMSDNRDKWNLIKLIPEDIEKNVLIVGAKFDSIAPIDIHHTPLVDALNNKKNISMDTIIFETGHSFSDSRIVLTQRLIDWLRNISF